MKHTASILILSLLAGLNANAREWTSSDGRKIEAAYLGRAQDGISLVLLRDDSLRVTVPVTALSPDDQAYAVTLPRVSAPIEKAATLSATGKLSDAGLAMVKGALPAMPEKLGLIEFNPSHADCVQFVDRYSRAFALVAMGDPAMGCRFLRTQIARDIKDLTPIANSTARGPALNARCNLLWLNSRIVPLLAKVEAEIGR